MLLYKFGGFYMDLDIECHKPMDALRAYPFIMPQTRPIGFSNDFLASTPGEASPPVFVPHSRSMCSVRDLSCQCAHKSCLIHSLENGCLKAILCTLHWTICLQEGRAGAARLAQERVA